MKILYDHQIFINQVYGGPSRYFIKLVNEISKSEDVKIGAALHINSHLSEITKDKVIGYNINNLFLNNIPYRIKNFVINKLINKINIHYLEKLQKSFKPDLLHKTYFDNYNTKLPVVLTIYDLIHEKFHNFYGKEKDYRPKQYAIERADEIICISKNTLKDLNYYYDLKNKKVTVIYLGYEILNNRKDKNFNLPGNEKFLLYVGKRNAYKNFNKFIEAYSAEDKLNKNFKIYCFGGGKFKKNEIQFFRKYKIKKENIKHIEGNDSVLVELYKNANALIYPSKYEGFGLPILEAMSYGCPVICSNSSSIPEVGGDAVKYFDPDSVDSIKNAISDIIFSNSNISDLKKLSAERIKMFNWNKCANETIKVYKKLL